MSNLRLTCSECNSGWMSRAQEEAKPCLIALLSGDWSITSQDINLAIARWVTMVTMCVEFADPKTLATTSQDRSTLRGTNLPPENWYIFAGRCDGTRDATAFWHHAGHAAPSPPMPDAHPNTQSTVIYYGRSFFLSLTPPPGSIEQGKSLQFGQAFANGAGMNLIWPKPNIIAPHPAELDHEAVCKAGALFWTQYGPVSIPNWAPLPSMPPWAFQRRADR